MTVALVLVSHSAAIAEGLSELSSQMAPDVTIVAAGGLDDGGIGTSYDKIEAAIATAKESADSVVILTDLGSATMTAEAVLDSLEDDSLRYADAPLVEGAVAAAVAAQQGGDLAKVATSASDAGKLWQMSVPGSTVPHGAPAVESPQDPDVDAAREAGSGNYERTVVVADTAGLHARPAAQIAAIAAKYESEIFINGEPADSIMSIMALGIPFGATVTVSTADSDSFDGVDDIVAAIAAGLE